MFLGEDDSIMRIGGAQSEPSKLDGNCCNNRHRDRLYYHHNIPNANHGYVRFSVDHLFFDIPGRTNIHVVSMVIMIFLVVRNAIQIHIKLSHIRDTLLLETGFLAILVAPWSLRTRRETLQPRHHDVITFWLVRWLLFRFMFSSGVVKLTSQCPTWWGLTALQYHFESQCIPTPVAWFAHHLPKWLLKLGVVATYFIEIPVPFLFFAPLKSMQLFSFACQVIFQFLIIVTGNYNFFNLLTITLCLSLLDDNYFGVFYEYQFKNLTVKIIEWVVFFGLLYWTTALFSLQSIVMERGLHAKIRSTLYCLLFSCVAFAMFAISLVPHTIVHDGNHAKIWPVVRQWHDSTDKLHIVNSYGLFRRMTGIHGRPEVVIEGSHHIDSGWQDFEFYYKPGRVDMGPAVLVPHQPRLDWQMWFAALGRYNHNPWFVNLMYRLLFNQRDVAHLLAHNPFIKTPPKYIRATTYTYRYTAWELKKRKHR
uniref:Lipase maturation factor n=1 Tax=Strigamia maritima TaxID=126957 RepID=T1IZX0_STRMM